MSPRIRPGNARATELSIHAALRRCMEQAPIPFAITRTVRHTLVYGNSSFCQMAGLTSPDAIGTPIAGAFAPTEARSLTSVLDRAFRDGLELLDQPIDESSTPAMGLRCSVWPVVAADGRVEALGIELRKTSDADSAIELQRQVAEKMLLSALRERGLAEDADAARRRAAFLAEASRLLAQSVDQSSTLIALTKLVLPVLDAWCIVDVVDEDGLIRRLGIFHPNAEKQRIVRQLEASWTPLPDDPFGAPAMRRRPRTHAITGSIEETLAAASHSPSNLRLLRQLGIGSLLTVPLMARNKLLGAITFITSERNLWDSAEDVQLAEDVADRAALALDSAQVYELALRHQRSAEAANRAKSTFLSAMSHELRTPLNAIGGYIDILDMGLRGPVTEHQHTAFARVKTNQQHLALLVTEILNFARVESGQATYTEYDVGACDAMQHSIALVEPLFEQKGVVFDGITGNSAVTARADPERVTQILVNLLSNAIKFTPPGGHIGAECGVERDTVTIRVSDTGIGIPDEKHEAIFEPFIQLKEGLADREGGVGLGLAISRDLARAMNGDLTVESSAGEGARFTLSLPRA